MYAQQYVRYTKNETIAAAAVAAAAAALAAAPPLLPLPLRSSAAGPCRARYATSGPQQTGLCKKQGCDWGAVKQGCDWGACGRRRRRDLGISRRRDLATSLVLRVRLRRSWTRTRARLSRLRAIAGRKPRDETRPSGGEMAENGSRALSEQRASMKVYMLIYKVWRPAASLVGCMRCQVL